MTRHIFRWTAVTAAVLTSAAGSASAGPLGSAFTYQAHIADAGIPVGDSALPVTFRLFDAAHGGSMIGGPLSMTVNVVDGKFNADLDFGTGAFNGDRRWLEISVNGTVLSPRQEITAAPYALHTRGLSVDSAGNLGVRVATPGAGVHVVYNPLTQVGFFAGDLSPFGVSAIETNVSGAQTHAWFAENGNRVFSVMAGGATYLADRLGIGTTAPAARLHIAGQPGIDGIMFPDGTLQTSAAAAGQQPWTESAGHVYRATGNVGIGTTTPAFPLSFPQSLGDKIALWGDSGATYGFGIQPNLLQIHGNNPSSAVAFGHGDSANFIETMRVGGDGRVGIGTTNPAATLDVNGTARFASLTLPGNNAADGRVLTTDASGNASWQDPPAGSEQWDTDGNNIFTTHGGNVGIGTNNPVGSLDVVGGVRARGGFPGTNNAQNNGYTFNGSGDDDSGMFCPGDGELSFVTNALERIKIMSNGLVKIGAGNPTMSLQVDQNSPTFYNAPAIGGFNGFTTWLYMHISSSEHSLIWNHQSALRFGTETAPANGYSEKMRINANGNVGIGTSSPTVKLDVNGTTRARVVQVTGGADLAEPYDVADVDDVKPMPGMLVSIDAEKLGKLRIASVAYDRAVAGIISGANGINPGLVLSQEGSIADGEWPVATAGRVWCYCDAEAGGAIEPGDLVTTSPVVGHGMKAADSQRLTGAVVGKAMSRLERGRGLVLVLVSLQ